MIRKCSVNISSSVFC